MNFFIDALNTVIQVFIMTYLPYYFLVTNKEIDVKLAKTKLAISSISIFMVCMLTTYVYNNSNINATLITIICMIIMAIVYRQLYKKALVAYSISYVLVQIVAILVTSIFWPIISNLVHDAQISRLFGIYIPAMILELIVIINKNNVRLIYEYFTRSKRSLEFSFMLIILMDFIISISMMMNGWSSVYLVNLIILMAVIFSICILIYLNNMDNKYKEIDNLNKLLIDKNNELKKIKHDYGSQISYINGLHLMKQYDRLDTILKDIINGNNQVQPNIEYITNGDTVISSIVKSLDLGCIHLIVDEDYDSNLINMSSYDLHKVLSNILNNAITALKGEGLIFIKTYKIFNTVYISIKNNGPKIDPNIIEKIFDESFTTKNDKDGDHGYGLYICKEIIKNNNGKLSVYSDEKYTEFKITLFDQINTI